MRDLVELRNTTLGNIKVHLLGRDESDASRQPPGYHDSYEQIEFERYFKNQLSPWTESNLKLKCEDCGTSSEQASHRYLEDLRDSNYRVVVPAETANLCRECIEKRKADGSVMHEKSKAEERTKPAQATQSSSK